MPDSGQLIVQDHHQKSETKTAGQELGVAAEKIAMSKQWKMALSVFSAVFLVFLALFWETIGTMTAIWWGDRTYGHGLLIFPVSAFLIWNRRDSLLQIEPRPQVLGLIFLAGAVCAWLLADIMGVQLVEHLAFVAMLQCLVLTVFGWSVTQKIAFPLFFLVFAVPFGNFLVPDLQNVTANFASFFLRAFGVPVYVDDLYLHIPSADFVVAEACAGLRFLISTVVFGALLAYVMLESWWKRALILVLSVTIPIVANGFRAFGLIYLAHTVNLELALGFSHFLYGWVLFSIVTLCLLLMAMLFRDRKPTHHTDAEVEKRSKTEGSKAPLLSFVAFGLAAMLIVASGPAYSALTLTQGETFKGVELSPLSVAKPWSPVSSSSQTWIPVYGSATSQLLQTYSDGEQAVTLYVAFYADQQSGAEVVNEMNSFSDEEIWRRQGKGGVVAEVEHQKTIVRFERLASSGTKRLVWYWYWVDGQFTASPYVAKLLQARARLFGGNPAAAVVAVAADYEETPEEAIRSLETFLDNVTSFKEPLDAAARETRISGN